MGDPYYRQSRYGMVCNGDGSASTGTGAGLAPELYGAQGGAVARL